MRGSPAIPSTSDTAGFAGKSTICELFRRLAAHRFLVVHEPGRVLLDRMQVRAGFYDINARLTVIKS